MNRDLLEMPFDPAQIKQRRGRDGMLDYVEGHAVIARLNEAFAGQWSFEIVRHDILEDRDEILVLGKLSAEGVVKMQFGVAQITRDSETKAIISLGDDVKAAGTDALKKCATFLGVGLHLYGERSRARPAAPGGDRGRSGGGTGRSTRPAKGEATPSQPAVSGNGKDEAGQAPAPETPGRAGGLPVPPAQPTSQPASGQAPSEASPPAPSRQIGQAGNGRLDNAQHTALLALAKKRRLSQLELNQEALKRYGVQVPFLTYADAAHFIQALQALA